MQEIDTPISGDSALDHSVDMSSSDDGPGRTPRGPRSWSRSSSRSNMSPIQELGSLTAQLGAVGQPSIEVDHDDHMENHVISTTDDSDGERPERVHKLSVPDAPSVRVYMHSLLVSKLYIYCKGFNNSKENFCSGLYLSSSK